MRLRVLFGLFTLTAATLLAHLPGFSQTMDPDADDAPAYYVTINPVAPFTQIRSKFFQQAVPVVSNLESGIAVAAGKIWAAHFNVETRASFGTPRKNSNLFLVQSGFSYRYNHPIGFLHPYVGSFIKVYALEDTRTKGEEMSIINYLHVGCQYTRKSLLLDFRINQPLYALSWANNPDEKVYSGAHNAVFGWRSFYMPYTSINVGIIFK